MLDLKTVSAEGKAQLRFKMEHSSNLSYANGLTSSEIVRRADKNSRDFYFIILGFIDCRFISP